MGGRGRPPIVVLAHRIVVVRAIPGSVIAKVGRNTLMAVANGLVALAQMLIGVCQACTLWAESEEHGCSAKKRLSVAAFLVISRNEGYQPADKVLFAPYPPQQGPDAS